MCFKGSFSNIEWCESSEQTGKTAQVSANETSILATHETFESCWISWSLLPKQWRWVFTKRHDSVLSRIAKTFLEEWNVIRKSCWLRKSKDQKNRTLNNRGRTVFIHEVFWFMRGLWMDLSSEVADIHMRTDAKNLVTTARTFHLPQRKQSTWLPYCGSIHDLAHIPTQNCLEDCLTVIVEGRQLDHSSEKLKIVRCRHSSKFQDTL